MAERFVFVRGEIALATAPDLVFNIGRAIAAGDDDLVIDCFDLTFMDMAGVRVLMVARQELAEAGRGLEIRNLSPSIQRIFDLVGVAVPLNVVVS